VPAIVTLPTGVGRAQRLKRDPIQPRQQPQTFELGNDRIPQPLRVRLEVGGLSGAATTALG
jgi:hypothetical protein